MAGRGPQSGGRRNWTEPVSAAARSRHPLDWVSEPLAEQPSYLRRKLFGCEAFYLAGRLVLVTTARAEPWNGLLVPTERQHHESLRREFASLSAHPVLPKWLYLSQSDESFEETAVAIVERILGSDPRIGVEPKARSGRHEGRRR